MVSICNNNVLPIQIKKKPVMARSKITRYYTHDDDYIKVPSMALLLTWINFNSSIDK